jgi:hypothetical protein
MIEFGKYVLKYVPPASAGIDPTVDMSISSEANLNEMLEFFTSFLKASGYYIEDNKELVFERTAPDFSDVTDKWDMAEPAFWGGYPSGFAHLGGKGGKGHE